MNLPVILVVLNLILFTGIAFYFAVQKKQLQEDQELWLSKRKVLDDELEAERETVAINAIDAKSRSEFIITESESIANEVIEYLQNALGQEGDQKGIILPGSENYEYKLDQLRQAIKKQYSDRVKKLLAQLERFEVDQAQKFQQFAESQEALTDQNLQAKRVEMLQKMEARLATYKNEEVALFQEKVQKIVNEAAIDVLGHALTETEHEELILSAIKKAKMENGL